MSCLKGESCEDGTHFEAWGCGEGWEMEGWRVGRKGKTAWMDIPELLKFRRRRLLVGKSPSDGSFLGDSSCLMKISESVCRSGWGPGATMLGAGLSCGVNLRSEGNIHLCASPYPLTC